MVALPQNLGGSDMCKGHEEHALDPIGANMPSEHRVHIGDANSSLYVAGGHSRHSGEPIVEYVDGGHWVSQRVPTLDVVVPAGHGVQLSPRVEVSLSRLGLEPTSVKAHNPEQQLDGRGSRSCGFRCVG